MKTLALGMCCLTLMCACATGRPDRFYVLSVQPPGSGAPRAPIATQMTLKLTLPALVDRAEMIVNTSDGGIIVLEHERWGAPLADMVAQTLARDLERRRGSVLVADRRFDRSAVPTVRLAVDIVQISIYKAGAVSLETHWRIIDPRTGADTVGSEVVSAPVGHDGYLSVAQALSACLGQLADRLLAQLPAA